MYKIQTGKEKTMEAVQKIDLEGGKYIHYFNEKTGEQWAERHGEQWRDLSGDKLVLSLAQKIYELEKREGYEQ
jgi:hypothetical protein